MDPEWVNDGSIHMEKKGLVNIHFAYGNPLSEHGYIWKVENPVRPIHCDNTVYHGAFWLDGKPLF